MTVSCSPWWWVPVAACGATSVIPAHIPFEPTVSPDTAVTRCIPDVCAVFGSKVLRLDYTHGVGPRCRSLCRMSSLVHGHRSTLSRAPRRARRHEPRPVERFRKNQQVQAIVKDKAAVDADHLLLGIKHPEEDGTTL